MPAAISAPYAANRCGGMTIAAGDGIPASGMRQWNGRGQCRENTTSIDDFVRFMRGNPLSLVTAMESPSERE